jgi:hypothetical protein
MNAAPHLIERLRCAGCTAKAGGGKLSIEPKAKVTPELRELVRKHKDDLITELQRRWPGAVALARNFAKEPPRTDELPPQLRRPVAIITNPWLRRRRG